MRIIFTTLTFLVFLLSSYAQNIENIEYMGWQAYKLSNEFNSVHITPEIGGRIIQLEFNDAKLFWENSDLYGVTSPETGLDKNGEWLNYGGEKLWPAPQGWDNNKQWHGPPDAILDGGVYYSEILEDSIVYLKSKSDTVTGIQFERRISLIPNSTGVNIVATMTNVSKEPVRWGVWSNAQLDASYQGEMNKKFKVYCPINSNSKFIRGYNVVFGLVNNPQWQTDNNMMIINYKHHVGKVVLDSDAGWVATVNGETGNVFVQKFNYINDGEYPDNASVEIWTQGLGSFYAWGKINTMSDDTVNNPYLVESETISQFANLLPGERYNYHYQWFTTNIGGDFPVIEIKNRVIISELGYANRRLKGRLASFNEGTISLIIEGEVKEEYSITPTVPLVIDAQVGSKNFKIVFKDETGSEVLFKR